MLRDLVAPTKPGTKPLEKLLQKLEHLYSPRPAEIVQLFRFHTCFRKPGAAIAADNFILVSGNLVKLLLRSSPDCAHCLNTVLLEIFWRT